MIFDNVKNAELYYGVNPGFKKAFEFIRKVIAEGTEPGKYEIDGDKIYASVQIYDTRVIDSCGFEGHENYIDVQCIISGRELMGSVNIDTCTVKEAYNPEYDITIYETNELAAYCPTGEGDFCVFYPEDIHRPGVAYKETPATVKKVVVKVRVDK